jgi:hypothetical protein
MVYLLSAQDSDGEHQVIVLSGGHGVSSFIGESVAESFHVDSVGRYCLGSKYATEATPTKLAAASGMSLAYRVNTPNLDLLHLAPQDPVNTPTAVARSGHLELPTQESPQGSKECPSA